MKKREAASKAEKTKAERASNGGVARAEALSPEVRSAIARKAALSRWDAGVPQATHDGEFKLGSAVLTAAVLPNGKRLLTQSTFLTSLGRSRTPKAGTGALTTGGEELPFFLQADALRPFITEELSQSTTPIFFRTKNGGRGVGYDAELLPMVCEVYLKMRDATDGRVPQQYRHIVRACDTLMRGLARVGIVALVDEATGYQETRDRKALQAILDRYLRTELAAWAKRFPDDFYREIFRLREWTWKGMSVNRPQAVAQYTKDLIYARLAPGILKELEARTPIENGRRKAKLHQWLTDEVGHPALAQHLHATMTLQKVAKNWTHFMGMMDVALPRRGDSLTMPFMADEPPARPNV